MFVPKRFYLAITFSCLALTLLGFFLYPSPSSEEEKSGRILEKLRPVGSRSVSTTPTLVSEMTPSTSVKLLFVGDIMLDRSVMLKTQAAGDWNHPFSLVDPLFKRYNLRIANLEGPITTFPSIANGVGGARFTFTFSPNFVDPLKQRFEYLSLANNHTYNFGEKGLIQARGFLEEAEIGYFGDPDNRSGFLSTTTTYEGITFGLVGYHQLVETGFDRVIAEVKTLDPLVDMVVILPHWGEEYITDEPTVRQSSEAHELIQAGADLIIGAHPHVVQPIEVYEDRVIFYSLGNFIFDQYFSEETMTGLAVGLNVIKQEQVLNLEYQLIPLDINTKSQPSVANKDKTATVLEQLSQTSRVTSEQKNLILLGNFSSTLPL